MRARPKSKSEANLIQPPRRSKPTIRAVAERAEVAISTVSRVINGGQASEATQRKVNRAIQELGYSPSLLAQSLKTRRAGCIGLAVNSSQSPWFSEILLGIEEALVSSRRSVLLCSMMLSGSYDPSQVFTWIQEGRIDGLLLVRFSLRDQPLLDSAIEAGLPVVLIAPDLDLPSNFIVRAKNLEAGRIAANHLIELGHRRIAFAGGPEQSIDTRLRLSGVQQALREKDLPLPTDRIWFGPGYHHQAGIQYARERFLPLPPHERPTAVILGNDPMALGFLRTVQQAGHSVPQHVSLIGFDGTPDGQHCWPGLTTVRQPSRKMAADACQILLDGIHTPPTLQTMSTEYPVELLIRESTAPPDR